MVAKSCCGIGWRSSGFVRGLLHLGGRSATESTDCAAEEVRVEYMVQVASRKLPQEVLLPLSLQQLKDMGLTDDLVGNGLGNHDGILNCWLYGVSRPKSLVGLAVAKVSIRG